MNEQTSAAQNMTQMSQNMQQQAGPYIVPTQAKPVKEDTEETKRMKEEFGFFGPMTFLYALFYAFCMFKNGSGVTFPFFIAASLLYLCFSLSKLGLTLKKGSGFYMMSMILLSVSTFCTDDARIIAFNKTGIFLLMMSLLLKQFYDTSKWKFGKYVGSIFWMVFASLGELVRPFTDAAGYFKSGRGKNNKNVWYIGLGVVLAVPLVIVVVALLAGADAVFRQLTNTVLRGINIGNLFNVFFRISFIFFASYLLIAYLCKHSMSEDVKDHRKGEPVLAITITGLLSVIYLLFSGIQILGLFLGKLQLPEGYTYAQYAREGFFQLLAVSILNLIIVLVCMSFFRESKVLKVILTIMSLCTFIMIASSAVRMLIYIRFYYLTFLRILVLWALALLFVLFLGVVAGIFREQFPLFRYSMVVVTILYLVLSFSHPDYIIASVNVANAPRKGVQWQAGDFFLAESPYSDYAYLSNLSADAAPVLIPYMRGLGYDFEALPAFRGKMTDEDIKERERFWMETKKKGYQRFTQDGFGYYYLERLQWVTENFGIRTYNVSRHMALQQIERNIVPADRDETGYPKLSDQPIAFTMGYFLDQAHDDMVYGTIEYQGRTYIGFGTISNSFKPEVASRCVGYIVQDENSSSVTDLMNTDRRVYTLAGDPNHDFLMDYDSSIHLMNQPDFFRAIDTQGEEIAIPDYIDGVGYEYWE